MPGRFLSAAEREKLDAFPEDISADDIFTFFTLSDSDLKAVPVTSAACNRLGFALQLGALRYLGFHLDIAAVPCAVVEYVARQLGLDAAELKNYGQREQTRTAHCRAVQRHLGFRVPSREALQDLQTWLVQRALEHDKPSLLLQMACERLYTAKTIRPGLTSLERMVTYARQQAQAKTYQQLAPLLTAPRLAFLDSVLIPSEDIGCTPLAWLRWEATANTPDDILRNIRKLEYLRTHDVDQWDLSAITPNRRKFLARCGGLSTNQSLQRAQPVKRYPILAAFLRWTFETRIDELVELFDRCLGDCYTRSKGALRKLQLENAPTANKKLIAFREMLRILIDPAVPDGKLRPSLFQVMPEDKCRLTLEECDLLIRPLHDHGYDFLGNRYGYIRKFSSQFLGALTFRSNQPHDPLLDAIRIIRELDEAGKRRVPADAPIEFIQRSWRPYLKDEQGKLNRKYYEIGTLWHLRAALRSGDVWVENSRRYADPESYLIPKEQWVLMREEECRALGLPLDAADRIRERQSALKAYLAELDEKVGREDGIRLENSKLIISRLKAEEVPESAVRLQDLISERLPLIDLHHLVVEVDRWTNYSKHFDHAGGSQPRTPGLVIQIYTSLLAQAGNFGSEKMAEIVGLSAAQLIWCTNWYLRGETLQPAINDLVNYQYHLPLARHWGSGTMSSSDGQRFPMGVKARNSAVIPRYSPGRILTLCSWTADIHAQWRCKAEPPMVRDATYVLDGILDNETELPLFEHTTDTAGYTELIFALFDLLGLQFSPRIKDLGDQSIYSADKGIHYKNIHEILSGMIKDELVREEWDTFLRLAVSMAKGHVTASLFVSKLQSQLRQSRLLKALQEYGRLVKSVYIAKYICREDQQRRVSHQLNKGEGLHNLRQWLFHADEGRIKKSQLRDQAIQADALTLVADAVIVWNTVYMQAVIDQLESEGFQISDTDKKYLSPCRFEHINKYGKISFDLEKELNRASLRPLRPRKQI